MKTETDRKFSRAHRWRLRHPEEAKRRNRIYRERYMAKGRTARKGQPWTAREDRMLLAGDRTHVELAKKLGRTISALQNRKRNLMQIPPDHLGACPRTAEPWSLEEIDALRSIVAGEDRLGMGDWARVAAKMGEMGFSRTAAACAGKMDREKRKGQSC